MIGCKHNFYKYITLDFLFIFIYAIYGFVLIFSYLTLGCTPFS